MPYPRARNERRGAGSAAPKRLESMIRLLQYMSRFFYDIKWLLRCVGNVAGLFLHVLLRCDPDRPGNVLTKKIQFPVDLLRER